MFEYLVQNKRKRRRVVQIGKHDEELVATHAPDGVGLSDAISQPRRDRLEQSITDGMPERVVDELEVVEIEEEQSDLGRGAIGSGHRLGDSGFDQQAVWQIGERG